MDFGNLVDAKHKPLLEDNHLHHSVMRNVKTLVW